MEDIHRQTDGRTDTRAGGRAGGQAGRQVGRQAGRQAGRQLDSFTDFNGKKCDGIERGRRTRGN